MTIRIGTRGSRLARAQTGEVARALEAHGHHTETVLIDTDGDRATDRPFHEIGAAGVFVRRLEEALIAGAVDLAVHSYKDLPSRGPAELTIGAVPARRDPRDVLLVRPEAWSEGETLPIAKGARVGTASARRRALVADLRGDLEVALVRGNVPTRIRRLTDGDYDAIILAAAGLARLADAAERGAEPLAMADLRRFPLAPEAFVPAPSQGAVALQHRKDDRATAAAVAPLSDADTAAPVAAERHLLRLVEGNCTLPFGAWCRRHDGRLELFAVLGDDHRLRRARATGDDPITLAEEATATLRAPDGA